ncbi:CDP-diacylglycerol diphosphatase [Paraburkholderia sp.]|uniref:CDP-diacylglycerol diphosphatase n=1 Tax=Paraburkholderia sp. TaxID=1926495 RepID=UPI003D6DB855
MRAILTKHLSSLLNPGRRSGPAWAAALGCAFAIVAAVAGCAKLAGVDHDALWKIVDLQCVPAAQAGTGSQCAQVDLQRHYAILKDISGKAQHLLIPTDRVTGIESPAILSANLLPYWSDAWTSRRFVEISVKQSLADNQLGIEINSQFRRSQDQLHIHIDCMRADVTDALARHRDDTPGTWRWDTVDGKRYRIMRVTSLDGVDDPFRIVARDHDTTQAMAIQTILVTGAGTSAARDGWLIVNSDLALDQGTGTAEGLLDHACRVARPAAVS